MAGVANGDKPRRPRILLLAPPGSYRIAPYLFAARRLGIEPLIASTGKHALVSMYDEGLNLDFDHPDEALAIIREAAGPGGLAAVVATDDATVALASEVSRAFGLPGNDPEAALLSRRKDLGRSRLQEAGLPVPVHRRIDLHAPLAGQVADFPFPCVVKPLAMSGSRGVIRADDLTALEAACRRVAGVTADSFDLYERGHALLEAYLPGEEIALEGMLSGGKLQVLALFDKPDPLVGPFFEETYYITPSRHTAALQQRAAQRVAEACAAYGLREGPIHAELRLHDGEAWLIEVAARTIGGQCARLLRFGTDSGLEELVITHALGRTLPDGSAEGAGGVLMLPIGRGGILRRVEGVLAAKRVAYVEEVEISVREGYELVPLPEGSSYLGFIFARGPSPEVVEQALREAYAELRVVVAPVLFKGVGQAAETA